MNDTEFVKEFFFSNVEGVILNIVENVMNNSGVMGMDLQLFDAEKRCKKALNKDQYKERQSIAPEYTDDLFKEHFRMSRRTCGELVRIIGHRIPGKTDYFADLPKKVIFTICYLANQESFLATGQRFGFAKSTAYKVFREILSTLADMLKVYVKFPDRSGSNREALIFQRRSRGFPGVVGAIDICHIAIKAPTDNRKDFYNKNKKYSMILQGICDHKARFIDVFIGIPARMHDAKGFRQSKIFKKLNSSTTPLLPPHLHIVGDSAYPLLENVMTPYRDNDQLTTQQHNYNVKFNACHSIIGRAYGLLKEKFKRLKYLDISTPEIGKEIISAACTLHNFLINRNEIDFQHDNEDAQTVQGITEVRNQVADEEVSATAKRNHIAETLL